VISLLLLGLSAFAALLQLSLPLAWSPFDLPLLIAAFAGLTRGEGWGLLCGAFAGALLDALYSPVPGLRFVPLVLAGALADALQPGVNREQPRLQVASVLLLTVVHDAAMALVARSQDLPQGGLSRALLAFALPRLAGQALATVPLFLALGLLIRRKAFQDPRARGVQTLRRWR
jgi:rod shape-determining protein MreD